MAVECLKIGKEWVAEKVHTLEKNRELVWNAVKSMKGTVKTCGAFYFLIKLPEGVKDMDAVTYLATKWNVLVIPCNSTGVEGYLRVSYGNLRYEDCQKAAEALKQGLESIQRGKWLK